ncbi:MAG: CHAD domain-containing protein [Bdellovibrionales bacterium]
MSVQIGELERAAELAKSNMDPDAIHDLRVASRRLQVVLWMAGSADGERSFHDARKSLKVLIGKLGRRRDLDVASEAVEKYDLNGTTLKKKRLKAGEQVSDALRTETQSKLLKQLYEALEAVENSHIDLAKATRSLGERLSRWLEEPPQTAAEFHELRIELKRARYVLEALGYDVEPLRKIQDQIGLWHDLEVLKDLEGSTAKINRDMDEAKNKVKKLFKPSLKFAVERLNGEFPHPGP